MMKEYVKDLETVGSDPIEGIITQDLLIKWAKASSKAINEGRIKSIKQLKKESGSWK